MPRAKPSPRPDDAKPPLVAILAYDRLCMFEFGCAVELFALERPELGVAWYRHAICAADHPPPSGARSSCAAVAASIRV